LARSNDRARPLTRPDRGRPARLAGGPPSPALYRRGGGPGHTVRDSPPPPLTPPTTLLIEGSARPTGSPPPRHSPFSTPVTGKCRWRPEGDRYPCRPSPPQDLLLSDPEFLNAISAMVNPSSSASAPPPAHGLCLLLTPSLSQRILDEPLVNLL